MFLAVLRDLFGTALPPLSHLTILLLYPVVVWGADELWRLRRRARGSSGKARTRT